MNKNFWFLISIAFLLRVVISLFTYHSDIQNFDLAGFVLSKGYILSFYDFFPGLSSKDQMAQVYHGFNFNYPPAVYFLLGPIANFFAILSNNQFRYDFIFNIKTTLGSINLFIHLLTLKLPYFLFDFGIAYLFSKIFQGRQRYLAILLWLFNPISLYSIYFMGQFDIIPTFFTVLSFYLVLKDKKYYLAALALGFGVAFKIYPLFLLVPLASLAPSWRKRFYILVIGISPYLLTILPFLTSHGFRSSALVAGQTLKSFYAQIPISGGESILLFPAAIIFLYIIFLKRSILAELIWQRILITLFIFFIFTHFHPQWLLWITPFLITEAVLTNFKNILAKLIIVFSWFGMIWFFDPGLNIGLLSPVFSNLYDSQSIWQMFSINLDYNFARSILQSIFVGGAIYYLYLYIRPSD